MLSRLSTMETLLPLNDIPIYTVSLLSTIENTIDTLLGMEEQGSPSV
jgi:hypothetical protein